MKQSDALSVLMNPAFSKESRDFLLKLFQEGGNFKMVFRLSEPEMTALHHHAYALYGRQQFPEAFHLFQLLRQLDPFKKDFHISFALLARSLGKDPYIAVEALNAATLLDNQDPMPPYYLAAVYMETHNKKLAKASLLKSKDRCGRKAEHRRLVQKLDSMLTHLDSIKEESVR